MQPGPQPAVPLDILRCFRRSFCRSFRGRVHRPSVRRRLHQEKCHRAPPVVGAFGSSLPAAFRLVCQIICQKIRRVLCAGASTGNIYIRGTQFFRTGICGNASGRQVDRYTYMVVAVILRYRSGSKIFGFDHAATRITVTQTGNRKFSGFLQTVAVVMPSGLSKSL